YKVGTEVKLVGKREGKPLNISVKLLSGKKKVRELPSYVQADLGLTLRELSYQDHSTAEGLLVTEVASGGWAALAGIDTGDTIRQVNGVPVKTLEDFKAKMASLKGAHAPMVVFYVVSGSHASFVEVRTEWSNK
ncbi:MAG: PDZ domain-containing protein, partial [Armatimonadota bacterium]